MRHGAVAAQVAVPGVMLPVDAVLGHARVEHVEALLALAAADDLADAAGGALCRSRAATNVVDRSSEIGENHSVTPRPASRRGACFLGAAGSRAQCSHSASECRAQLELRRPKHRN